MSSTEQTKKDIDDWTSDHKRSLRYDILKDLATYAGIDLEFGQVSKLHFMNMDYKDYMINILAMAKIRELRRIGDNKRVVERVDW